MGTKRKSSGGDRKNVKRRKTFTQKQEKTIKTIAKKVTNSLAETKFFTYQGMIEPNSGSITSWNLFYHGVSRGSGNNQFDGDKLQWRGIKLKYQIENYYVDITTKYNMQPFEITMMIVSTPVLKTTTNLTQAELQNDTTTNFGLGFLDNDVKMLYKKKIPFNLGYQFDADDPKKKITGSIWLSRRQMLSFVDFQQGYNLGRANYYFVIYANSSIGGPIGHIDFTWQNYFKDS